MADDSTTVQVSTETWKELNGRKQPGESFDDVIRRELGLGDEADEPNGAIDKSDERQTADGVGAVDEPDAEAYPGACLPDELADEVERYANQLDRAETDHADQRVAAARAVGRMLAAEGGVSRSEAQDRLLPRYGVPEASETKWWEKAAKERFADLDSIVWDATRGQFVVE